MSALAPLAYLAELFGALQPQPPGPQPAAAREPGDAAAGAFELLLDEAREARSDRPPGEREPVSAGPDAAGLPLASPVPAPLPSEPVEPEKPAAGKGVPLPPTEPASPSGMVEHIARAASPVNLVLGTAPGASEPEPTTPPAAAAGSGREPARSSGAPAPRRAAAAADPIPARLEPAADPAPPAASDAPAPAREHSRHPAHEPPPVSPLERPEAGSAHGAPHAAVQASAQPGAHADAPAQPTPGSVAGPELGSASAPVSHPRETRGEPQLPRALPELPARGEVEVVRSVHVLAGQGGGRVHIRLDPPELGGLSLRVVVSDGAVHVSLLADQAPVAELLQRHATELRSALESQGLRLDQLDVGTGGAADGGARDAHARDAEPRPASASRGFAPPSDAFARGLRRFDVHTLGAVDLHV
jgi:flagellar hook-length control protein FliK